MRQQPDSQSDRERFQQQIRRKEARRLRARRIKGSSAWSGIGTFGMVGWSIAVPAVMGIAAGIWLDGQAPQPFSWTLTLMIGGVVLGCMNAWYWVNREQRLITQHDHEEQDEDVVNGHE